MKYRMLCQLTAAIGVIGAIGGVSVKAGETLTMSTDVRPAPPESVASKARATEGFTLTIQLMDERPSAGELIWVETILKNVSQKELSAARSSLDDFSYSVTDARHKPVPLTHYGRVQAETLQKEKAERRPPRPTSVRGIRLSPGKMEREGHPISQTYDMTLPGKYIIRVRQRIPKRDGSGVTFVSSNPLFIELDPPVHPSSRSPRHIRERDGLSNEAGY